jgi:hypothetical protein
MDLFYRPPLMRPDECKALEENYMNCMMQKAMRDKVPTNMCNLDSLLWFHLECPKHVDSFDNPTQFKAKWRDWFSEQKQTMLEREASTNSPLDKKVAYEHGHIRYPEDVREFKKLTAFKDDF